MRFLFLLSLVLPNFVLSSVYSPVSYECADEYSIVELGCHRSTKLKNGTIFLLGIVGDNQSNAKLVAQVFNPKDQSLKTFKTPFSSPAFGFTMTTLNDGRVLILGGMKERAILGELNESGLRHLYDPKTNSWTEVNLSFFQRVGHQTISLNNDNVLIVGGITLNEQTNKDILYNSKTNTWEKLESDHKSVIGHTLTKTKSGEVIIAGGQNLDTKKFSNEIKIFNPKNLSLKYVTRILTNRAFHEATLLDDGRLVIGSGFYYSGLASADLQICKLSIKECFRVPRSNPNHMLFSLIARKDNTLIVFGGGNTERDSIESRELITSYWRWKSTKLLNFPRFKHTHHILDDGSVFVYGGRAKESRNTAEILKVDSGEYYWDLVSFR